MNCLAQMRMKMMHEQWRKWNPLSHAKGPYFLERLCDDINGFHLVLADKKGTKKLTFTWKQAIQSCTRIDKTAALETIAFLNTQYGPECIDTWSFFIVHNSNYLKRLSQESGTLSDFFYGELIHFAIITPTSILHIIAEYEPTVT